MPHDDRADLFRRLAPAAREALLPALSQAEGEDLRRLAAYPEGTAGAVMTSDYATLAPGRRRSGRRPIARRSAGPICWTRSAGCSAPPRCAPPAPGPLRSTLRVAR